MGGAGDDGGGDPRAGREGRLHGRAQLRGQRPGPARGAPVGGADGSRGAVRAGPDRLGGEHGDALREGLRLGRLRGRRHRQPLRRRLRPRAVDMDKGDFIGRRSLVRDRNVGGVRPNVVGLLPEDPSFVPPDGTPLVEAGAPADAPPVIGYVSQGCHSPNVGRAIALAVLDDGRRRIDGRIEIAGIRPASARAGDPPVFRRPRRQSDEGLRGWVTRPFRDSAALCSCV